MKWFRRAPATGPADERQPTQRIKQVILIRKDLTMRRGKEIAQGSHAAMEFIIDPIRVRLSASSLHIDLNAIEKAWITRGMAKVCLRVNSEEELLSYHEKALELGLKSYLIRDSGRTEFGGQPTYTSCAIGPDEIDRIDAVTGDLVPY